MLYDRMEKPEVLAPAGSFDALKAAVYAGADAVYVGGSQFGARAFANNFSKEEMIEAISFVHKYGVHIYMTVNTLLKEKEMREEVYSYLLPFYEAGLDAVIVQDFGVFTMIRECFPDLAVHVSTQMGIMTKEAAQILYDLGATRVVPARELSFEEVKAITSIKGLEVECFVHGALCYCYSGQCFLSSRIGGRSGNRGRCAQPCRLQYDICKKKEKHSKIQTSSCHILSPKDLCTIDFMPELIQAGIYSFKIEGRMKKPEYVATVVSVYRKYMDKALECIQENKPFSVEEKDKMLLMQMYNRGGFTDGYYTQHNGGDMMEVHRPNHHGVYLGKVERIGKNNISFQTQQKLFEKDSLELRLDHGVVELTSPVSADKKQWVTLNASRMREIKVGDLLYRMKSPHLITEVMDDLEEKRPLWIVGTVRMKAGEPITLEVEKCGFDERICVVGDVVEPAQKQPATIEQITKVLSQLGGTGYRMKDITVILEGDVFLPVKQLKQLRRELVSKMEQHVREQYERRADSDLKRSAFDRIWDEDNRVSSQMNSDLIVSVATKKQFDVVKTDTRIDTILVPWNWAVMYSTEIDVENNHLKKDIYAVLPTMFRRNEIQLDLEHFTGTGVVVNSFDSLAYIISQKKKLGSNQKNCNIILGSSIYQYNTYAHKAWIRLCERYNLTITGILAPKELELREIEQLSLDHMILPLYGRLTLMTSAQCVKKSLGLCDKTPSYRIIKDRKGKEYIVKSMCENCQSILLEKEPVSLSDCSKDVSRLGDIKYYIEFETEDSTQMNKIIDSLWGEYVEQNSDYETIDGNTGYYYKGIE